MCVRVCTCASMCMSEHECVNVDELCVRARWSRRVADRARAHALSLE